MSDKPKKSTICAAKSGDHECSLPRVRGTLFCSQHQRSDYRRRMGSRPITNEQLAYMMQRDGQQQ